MQSTQKKFLKLVETAAIDVGLEAVNDTQWANVGSIKIQSADSLDSLLTVSYDFQNGYATFFVDEKRRYMRDEHMQSFLVEIRERIAALGQGGK